MDDDTQDVELETEDNEPRGHGDAEHRLKKLKDELEHVKKERQEYLDGWQRSKADYVNLLKRMEQGAKESETRGRVKAVEALLPAFDALERAKEHGEVPEGFMAIAKQLESAFASLGLEAVGKVGERFDPSLHEALGQDPTQLCEEDDIITAVLEKGWRVGDSVVRPAKVRVAHYEAEA